MMILVRSVGKAGDHTRIGSSGYIAVENPSWVESRSWETTAMLGPTKTTTISLVGRIRYHTDKGSWKEPDVNLPVLNFFHFLSSWRDRPTTGFFLSAGNSILMHSRKHIYELLGVIFLFFEHSWNNNNHAASHASSKSYVFQNFQLSTGLYSRCLLNI